MAVLWSATGRPLVAQVYRLRVVTRDCDAASCRLVIGYASAVAVGRYNPGKEILVTARHAVDGTVHRLDLDIDGAWRPAVVLARSDDGSDLALLGLNHGVALPSVEVARQTPAASELVSLSGFPQAAGERRRMARVSAGTGGDWLTLDGPSLPGESGGGVFDADGRLAGVIFGTAPPSRPTCTLAVPAAAIRRLFRAAFHADPPCRPAPPVPPIASNPPIERERFEQIAADLTRRIERLERATIPVEILAPDGRLLDRREYTLGNPIQLRLIPKRE
jgi:hypothetical protein